MAVDYEIGGGISGGVPNLNIKAKGRLFGKAENTRVIVEPKSSIDHYDREKQPAIIFENRVNEYLDAGWEIESMDETDSSYRCHVRRKKSPTRR